ncbi:MAG: tRNA (adenosine(37)-N6)-dimethylallyltransferase MiaA [Elusimicrobiota bacterium]|jgi:tRNA dimethylallyltransferase|nr:tRNA (adenosine(37)-N6)-dimethylallyltransferase MiaA [Elusimicrobiota bacterium]
MKKIILVLGATASGKTKKAVEISKQENGEIISCDSRQIYKYLDIGSNKEGKLIGESLREIDGISQHLTDIIEPDKTYNAAAFAKDADKKIEEIIERKKVPVICGGTGLYVKALLYGLDEMPSADEKLRTELKNKSADELYEKLLTIDPQAATKHKGNPQRLMRALEINILSGKNLKDFFKPTKARYDFTLYNLDTPRDKLYAKINLRCAKMIKNGMIEETKKVLDMGFSKQCPGLSGIGYKLIIEFLDGKISKNKLIEEFSKETRHYAKRQITWFKKNPSAI